MNLEKDSLKDYNQLEDYLSKSVYRIDDCRSVNSFFYSQNYENSFHNIDTSENLNKTYTGNVQVSIDNFNANCNTKEEANFEQNMFMNDYYSNYNKNDNYINLMQGLTAYKNNYNNEHNSNTHFSCKNDLKYSTTACNSDSTDLKNKLSSNLSSYAYDGNFDKNNINNTQKVVLNTNAGSKLLFATYKAPNLNTIIEEECKVKARGLIFKKVEKQEQIIDAKIDKCLNIDNEFSNSKPDNLNLHSLSRREFIKQRNKIAARKSRSLKETELNRALALNRALKEEIAVKNKIINSLEEENQQLKMRSSFTIVNNNSNSYVRTGEGLFCNKCFMTIFTLALIAVIAFCVISSVKPYIKNTKDIIPNNNSENNINNTLVPNGESIPDYNTSNKDNSKNTSTEDKVNVAGSVESANNGFIQNQESKDAQVINNNSSFISLNSLIFQSLTIIVFII
jgi:hypothetical protein